MIRFNLIAVFLFGLNVSAADAELPPVSSIDPPTSWDTNVYTGESLAWEIKPGYELSGYRSYDPAWRRDLSYHQPILGLHGSAALQHQLVHIRPRLPRKGGWLARDLVNRCVVQDIADDVKEYVEFEPNGHALFTYVRGKEPPVLPLFYWTLDSEGYLLFSIHEDLHEPFRKYRLLKYDAQKLLVELDGKEFEWRYLQPKK